MKNGPSLAQSVDGTRNTGTMASQFQCERIPVCHPFRLDISPSFPQVSARVGSHTAVSANELQQMTEYARCKWTGNRFQQMVCNWLGTAFVLVERSGTPSGSLPGSV